MAGKVSNFVPSTPWIPEDDLLLKNSIEAGASLEALAKGAVKFSGALTSPSGVGSHLIAGIAVVGALMVVVVLLVEAAVLPAWWQSLDMATLICLISGISLHQR
ncbi:hypothetical protein POM88_052596 [Heracleum sosnowskyi]|uniref:Uncharacterized protein n=1 Tax=Heracleum sosnowskyi TaxID=360622 RepID=A0AAD8LY37_9APIA|nr:hypothetical protein POM88_052596 [Heracleum sosnowskyi]